MGRRQSKEELEPNRSTSPKKRLVRGLFLPCANDAVAHASSESPTRSYGSTEASPPNDAMEKVLETENSDFVVPYLTEASSRSDALSGVAAPPTTSNGASSSNQGVSSCEGPSQWASTSRQRTPRRNSRYEARHSNTCPDPLDSEAVAAPRRLCCVAPHSCPSRTPPHQQLQRPHQLASPSAMSSKTASYFSPLLSPTDDHTTASYPRQQCRPQLRALPVPDSHVLVFNTQMTSPMPTLVQGIPNPNSISSDNAHDFSTTAGSAIHFAPSTQAPQLSLHGQSSTQCNKKDAAAAVHSPMPPPRHRYRTTAPVTNELSTNALASIPPAAPALHFADLLAGSSQSTNHDSRDGHATQHNSTGRATMMRASGASLNMSPTQWSSTNTPHEFSGIASYEGGNGGLAFGPMIPCSPIDSVYSAAPHSFNSSSFTSSSSSASLFGQDPMKVITSPAQLTDHGFATWQNSSVSMMPHDGAKLLQSHDEVSSNHVGTSILMPRRDSSRSSADMTLGSTSFTSARLRRISREAETSNEVETVVEFVARMKATKRKAEGDSGGTCTSESAESTDIRSGLTSSSGGGEETARRTSHGKGAKHDSSGRTSVSISVPPPPPLRVSSERHSLGRPFRPKTPLDAPSDASQTMPMPSPQPALSRPISDTTTSPSVSLTDRDGTSAGSSRPNSSCRRRDVRASVEAALANISSSSAPAPPAASRRKRRDMSVNFLISPQ